MKELLMIDGRTFRVFTVSVRRGFRLEEGENSGMVMSGRKRRDLYGTYYSYTMVIDPSGMEKAEYDALYDIISAPVESHFVTVPYGQTTITYEAQVTAGDDALELMEGDDSVLWGNLAVVFDAIEPQRRPD